MIVRLRRAEDEEAFLDLAATDVAEIAPHLAYDRERVRQMFRGSIATGHPRIMVAESKGEVVGFCKASIQAYDFTDGLLALLEAIYVRPDKRGSKAAVLMALDFREWGIRDVKAKELHAGSVTGKHAENIARLFEKIGFTRSGYNLRIVP